jgi:F0F1-type ATP synthase assembly protein I
MTRYALIGTEFITIFGLLLLGGVMLDRKFGTQPVLTLVGLAGGFAMGLYKMVADLRRQERRDHDDREDRQDGPP